ncbi:hypothetical protein PENSPDRAFT_671198 [Peniophora sp. CONT]|nr:hypothetical protein PENSPDRAFT_671198 [Peniophora sp. CONT]
MADTPSPVFINLISDDSDSEDAAENTAEDVDMDGLSESGGPPDGSDSEGSIIIPAVPAAQGSEDDETDADSDAGDPGIPRRPTPDILREVSIPASGELNMPRIELDPYVMNHSHFADGFNLAPPLHSAFSKAGLHNSAHFKQWLDHFHTDQSRAPPYAEHLSDKDAVIFSQLDVNVQREARTLRVLRDLASAVEGDVLELERLEYIVTRMANGPVMRAAAAAQGADLQIPGWLRERAAATPPLLACAGDSTSSLVNNRQPNTREAGGTRAPKAGPSNTRVTAASGSRTSARQRQCEQEKCRAPNRRSIAKSKRRRRSVIARNPIWSSRQIVLGLSSHRFPHWRSSSPGGLDLFRRGRPPSV